MWFHLLYQERCTHQNNVSASAPLVMIFCKFDVIRLCCSVMTSETKKDSMISNVSSLGSSLAALLSVHTIYSCSGSSAFEIQNNLVAYALHNVVVGMNFYFLLL